MYFKNHHTKETTWVDPRTAVVRKLVRVTAVTTKGERGKGGKGERDGWYQRGCVDTVLQPHRHRQTHTHMRIPCV